MTEPTDKEIEAKEKMSWYLMNEGAKLGLMGDVPHEFFWNALKEWERITLHPEFSQKSSCPQGLKAPEEP